MAPFHNKSTSKNRVSKSVQNKRQTSHRGFRGERFVSSRLKDIVESEALEASNAPGEQNEPEESLGLSSDTESSHEDHAAANPYHSLLQSLSASNEARNSKNNPLSHRSAPINYLDEPKTQDELIDLEPNPLEESVVHESEEERDDHDDRDEAVAANDPFSEHLERSLEPDIQQYIQDSETSSLRTSRVDLSEAWKATATLTERSPPLEPRFCRIPQKLSSSAIGIKQRLRTKGDSILSVARGIELYLAQLFFGYIDVLFSERQKLDINSLRQLTSLHALNHALKTRDRVIRNNERSAQNADLDDGQLCDQGFTRPKVLFLLPTRHSCYKMISSVVALYEPEQQENRKRFQDNFGSEGNPISESKPQDFRDLFHGNDDDMFRVGVKFTRKTMKFFTQFYNSDMIFASPLGLRMAIGDQASRKQDYDFLSSIELVVVDQTDALLMQNWEHVEFIFDHLNLQPREAHGCDFGRVRPWYLDGNARYVRQSIILTAYNTPELNNIFNSKMLNYSGKIKISSAIYHGLISAPNALFKQRFSRFDAPSPSAEPDVRFAYFTAKLVPKVVKLARDNPGRPQGTLIFIPSYMDFVRIRNFFANSTTTRDVSFGSMSEYTAAPDVARARSHFLKGRHGVLLYTGRLHHFRRYQIKGAKHVIFYGLPDNPSFYKELASDFPGLGVSAGKVDPSEISIQVLFSRFDALRLERIVGTGRLRSMLIEKKGDVFDYIP